MEQVHLVLMKPLRNSKIENREPIEGVPSLGSTRDPQYRPHKTRSFAGSNNGKRQGHMVLKVVILCGRLHIVTS